MACRVPDVAVLLSPTALYKCQSDHLAFGDFYKAVSLKVTGDVMSSKNVSSLDIPWCQYSW